MGKRTSKQAKKQKRKQKRSQDNASPVPAADVVKQIREAVAENRGRRAWGLAKQLLQAGGDLAGDDRAAAILAFGSRLREMLADGHPADAVLMFNSLTASHPDWIGSLPGGLRLLLEFHGATPTLLNAYEASPETQAVVDEAILAELQDPAIAAGAALDPAHPVRSHACRITEAWDELESGTLGPGWQALASVPRRSPFAPWRLFLAALRAFYENDDEQVAECVRRLPSNTVPARLGEVLEGVIRDGMTSSDPAVRQIAGEVASASLRGRVIRLERMIATRRSRDLGPEMDSVCSRLEAAGHHSLAMDVCALVGSRMAGSGTFLPIIQRSAYMRPHMFDVMSRCLELVGDNEPTVWLARIGKAIQSGNRLEQALLEEKGAASYLRQAMEADDVWLDPPDEFYNSHGDGYEDGVHPGDLDLHERKDFIRAEKYFESSVTAYPLPDVFRSWIHALESAERPVIPVLQRWHKELPEDSDALYLLVDAARKQEDLPTALAAFEDLKKLVGRSPRLDALEPFLLLEQALGEFERGNTEAGEAFLARVPERTPIVRVAKDCLRSLNPEADRGEKARIGRELAAVGRPHLVWHCFRQLRPAFPKSRLPAPVRRQLDEPDAVVAGLLDMLAIPDEDWRPSSVPWPADFADALARTSLPTTVLTDCMRRLIHSDPSLASPAVRLTVFAATIPVLSRKSEAVAEALACRAMVYVATAEFNRVAPHPTRTEDRAIDCLKAAEKQPDRNSNDERAIASAARALESLGPAVARRRLNDRQLAKALRTEHETGLSEYARIDPLRRPPRQPQGRGFRFEDGGGFPGGDALADLLERMAEEASALPRQPARSGRKKNKASPAQSDAQPDLPGFTEP